MKMLIGSMWHADPARVLVPIEQLVAGLISVFDDKKSKLEARRKF